MSESSLLMDGQRFCPECGTELAPALLSCPRCQRLVHGEQLRELVFAAQVAQNEGRRAEAVELLERALSLLPQHSRQFAVIQSRVDALRGELAPLGGSEPVTQANAGGSDGAKKLGGLAAIGAGVFALLSKGKLLLLGLTKASTVLTMLAAFGVYWTAYGLKFAAGLVISIYVHEMGHVAALRRFGIKATAPMFIPGLGAIVRLKESPKSPEQDARVGLAGPIWGLAAALVAYAVYYVMHWPSWAAIAVVGAWINLFNLLPIWQLDGGRGFNSLSRGERWSAALLVGGLWWYTQEGLLLLILVVAVARALGKAPPRPDTNAWLTYVFLVVILSLMCTQHVPVITASARLATGGFRL